MTSKDPNNRLSAEDRLAISTDPRPSREVAAEYGVHHSHICKIRKEASDVLQKHWSGKQAGRPPAPTQSSDLKQTEEKLAEQIRRADLLDMRNDWLNLQLDFHKEREQAEEAVLNCAESAKEKLKRLKRKKRSMAKKRRSSK